MDEHSTGPAQPSPMAASPAQPAQKPWSVQIDVYLESDGPNPKFHVESCLPFDPAVTTEKILVFRTNHRPGFDILFQLHDLTGKGYRFPKRADDGVWSKKGGTCPNTAAHEVFQPIRVIEPDRTALVVHNENPGDEKGGAIGKFRYTLNVTTTDGAPFLPLDPGGDDQNGARTFVSM
jgi:hypothetical protein